MTNSPERGMQADDLLREVRRIQIRTNRMVDEVLGGEYHSAFKGRGLEFSEVREYVPGDDIRTIDWNVTARMGDPYVKRYVEERELTILLLVDVSDSMSFGSDDRLKRESLAEMAALLGFSAIKNNDQIGMVAFSDRIVEYVPPRKGVSSVLRMVRDLLDIRDGGDTRISVVLEHLLAIQKRRAVVFLISDFHDTAFEQPLKLAAVKHDLIPVRIAAGGELNPPAGRIMTRPLENGRPRMLDFGSFRNREKFRSALKAHYRKLDIQFRRQGLDSIEVTAGGDMYRAFRRFFDMRKRRLVR